MTPATTMVREEIESLRGEGHRGWQTRAATALGLTCDQVSRVLSGHEVSQSTAATVAARVGRVPPVVATPRAPSAHDRIAAALERIAAALESRT